MQPQQLPVVKRIQLDELADLLIIIVQLAGRMEIHVQLQENEVFAGNVEDADVKQRVLQRGNLRENVGQDGGRFAGVAVFIRDGDGNEAVEDFVLRTVDVGVKAFAGDVVDGGFVSGERVAGMDAAFAGEQGAIALLHTLLNRICTILNSKIMAI